jgi:hypothetical protein
VRPSAAQLELASAGGIERTRGELLETFFERCAAAGIKRAEFEQLDAPTQYHFDEQKPLAAAVQTDLHYFRTAQYLRLSRRALSLAGVELISVTPDSRLNDYFPYRSIADVLADIGAAVGQPDEEPTRGLYTQVGTRAPKGLGPMRDLKPHHWKRNGEAPQGGGPERLPGQESRYESDGRSRAVVTRRVRAMIDSVPETPVAIEEVG